MKSFVFERAYRIGCVSESKRIVFPVPTWARYLVGIILVQIAAALALHLYEIAKTQGWL